MHRHKLPVGPPFCAHGLCGIPALAKEFTARRPRHMSVRALQHYALRISELAKACCAGVKQTSLGAPSRARLVATPDPNGIIKLCDGPSAVVLYSHPFPQPAQWRLSVERRYSIQLPWPSKLNTLKRDCPLTQGARLAAYRSVPSVAGSPASQIRPSSACYPQPGQQSRCFFASPFCRSFASVFCGWQPSGTLS
jgi:hypothetical protein